MTQPRQHSATLNVASLDPRNVADLLNERFVALGRLLERATNRGGRLLRRNRAETRKAVAAADVAVYHEQQTLRRTQVRLSDLHLRVGEKLYGLANGKEDTHSVTRQLCALLEELDRLEGVLDGLALETAAPHTDPEPDDDTAQVPSAGGGV